MNITFDEGADERVQRALNDAKRTELAERFGLVFGETSSDLPAEVEADFLSNVEAFELQWATGATTTVREYIGNPTLRAPADVPPESLSRELDQVLELFAANNLCLDVLAEVPQEEIYRFIVEELLDETMNDIRVPGMDWHFIYEEFHPNEVYDAKLVAEWFLDRLFSHSEYVMHEFAADGLTDAQGRPTDRAAIERQINEFRHQVAAVIENEISIADCTVADGIATVRASVSWRGLERVTMAERSAIGDAVVRMRKGPSGEWEIVSFAVAGMGAVGIED